jgi:AcrR family transcriptional regulator
MKTAQKNSPTPAQRRILSAALRLFARNGYEAVGVAAIAQAVGVKAPSLYKHFKGKRDIFDHILRLMEQKDAEEAAACSLPLLPPDAAPRGTYTRAAAATLVPFALRQFRRWTEDPFASDFRKLLALEQFRSPEMGALYQQYLGSGPLDYVAALLGSRAEALAFYGPMHLLYSLYDASPGPAPLRLLERHLLRWKPAKPPRNPPR